MTYEILITTQLGAYGNGLAEIVGKYTDKYMNWIMLTS